MRVTFRWLFWARRYSCLQSGFNRVFYPLDKKIDNDFAPTVKIKSKWKLPRGRNVALNSLNASGFWDAKGGHMQPVSGAAKRFKPARRNYALTPLFHPSFFTRDYSTNLILGGRMNHEWDASYRASRKYYRRGDGKSFRVDSPFREGQEVLMEQWFENQDEIGWADSQFATQFTSLIFVPATLSHLAFFSSGTDVLWSNFLLHKTGRWRKSTK